MRTRSVASLLIDYTDKATVVAYKGKVVYKNPSRSNYNITHAARVDLYQSEWVVFRT